LPQVWVYPSEVAKRIYSAWRLCPGQGPSCQRTTLSAIDINLFLGLPFPAGFIVGWAIRLLLSLRRRTVAARYRAIKG
jgi:hypothetical protein